MGMERVPDITSRPEREILWRIYVYGLSSNISKSVGVCRLWSYDSEERVHEPVCAMTRRVRTGWVPV